MSEGSCAGSQLKITKGPISMPNLEAVLLSTSTVIDKRLIGGKSIISTPTCPNVVYGVNPKSALSVLKSSPDNV